MAYVEVDELLVIDGVDEDTAKELQVRAQEYLEEAARKALERARELGVEDSLVSFEGLTPKMIEHWPKMASKRWKILPLVRIGNWPAAGQPLMASG